MSLRRLNKRLTLATLLLALALPGSAATAADGDGGDEVDYVALAALMIRDGHYERARAALGSVDPAGEAIDGIRYHMLSGLVALHLDENQTAIDAFRRALAAGQTDPLVHIHLAQAHYRLEQFRDAIREIRSAGDLLNTLPAAWSMLAQSHWRLGEHGETWEVLAEAGRLFPDEPRFPRQKVFYLIELKLFQEAAEQGAVWLEQAAGGAADYLAIGSALRRSGQYRKAARFMEEARLRFPDNPDVLVELAHVWLDQGSTLIAAELFRQAAALKPVLQTEAAELYRKGGKLYRALYLNAGILDQEKKLKQRLAILLELQNYEAAAAMEEAMERTGLLTNEDIRYALAYVKFMTGQLDEAEGHLTKITRSDLIRKTVELRKAIRECRSSWTSCY